MKSIAEKAKDSYLLNRAAAEKTAIQKGWPIKAEVDGSLIEIQHLNERGIPQYYKTDNSNAAATISTNKVYSGGGAGLSLTGSGIIVREWDGGSVLNTHQEFGTRVTVVDAVATHYHATHVAGTIMASGVVANAKGMAYEAGLRSFDWNTDVTEMATEGAAGALISNHSYGYIRGWYSGTWYGDPAISTTEDYLFGFYDSYTQQWDQIAYNAPNFLICKSAGNDRGDSGSGYPADGPYDCIGQQGVAKNILTVGAVDDIPGGYTTPAGVSQTNTYFSSWGPADDGRIKPDIVANGYSLYSTYNTNNTSYSSLSGTSMSTPSASGSLALLQQHRFALTGSYLKAATLKAVVIHTADEAGANTGPDYNYGWGLMNTKNAALKISSDQTVDVISELTLNNGATYTRNIIASGTEPIKVTIVWTDPAGTPPAAALDPITPMLVNDLDLRLSYSSNTYYPWKLNRDTPTAAATNSTENNVDNVEVVYIASPVAGATYTITVDHDGSLTGGSQAYSVVISGILATVAPVADFSANTTTPAVNAQVNFTDISSNVPTTWAWSFNPATVTYLNGTTSASQNPQVKFTAAGTYSVTLTATNAYGSDGETKTNYISVTNCTFSSLPFIQNFDATTLPTCWSQIDNIGNGQIWQFGTITGYTPLPSLSGNYAYLNSDAYGSGSSQNADLITPTLDLTNYTGVNLTFSYYFRSYTGSSGNLFYSINNGVTWTSLLSVSATSSNPTVFNQTIAALAGQSQVKFKWNYTGSYGYYWAIDNVSVTGTVAAIPTVTTTAASAITTSSATAGGNVTATGGSSVTARGVCWSTSIDPVASGNHTTDGSGTGAFTSSITGLSANSLYYVRAYATNSSGTAYGINQTFTTCAAMLPASVSISASVNPVCAGTSVTFTAVPTNGGTTPSYQWKVNGVNAGTNSSTYAFVPSNGNVVTCVMTSNATCVTGSPATSNSVTMTVNPTVTASVAISASANPVCAGTSVTFTAVPTNGGPTPSYQWKVNGVNAGTNSSTYAFVPSNGNVVSCVMTSNATCVTGSPATSNSVTLTVNPMVTASVAVSASANPVCAGTSVTFTAVPTKGGTTPSYQWKVNGVNAGTNSPLFAYSGK
ncbi:MAG: S8 family serine peptidase [Bacteroidales bacterium]|nr:S8 family serine peptidase [Bacteroidales bacterium]